MKYPAIEFRNGKNITDEEAHILFDSIMKFKPTTVLEIGRYTGLSTAYICKALENFDEETTFFSLDFENAESGNIGRVLETNKINNVLLENFDYYKELKERAKKIVKESDFVYIDGCHEEVHDLWRTIEPSLPNVCIVMFHDALCEDSETMKVKSLITKISKKYSTEIIKTSDNEESPNGYCIVFIEKKSKAKPKKENIYIEEDKKQVKIVDTNKSKTKTTIVDNTEKK